MNRRGILFSGFSMCALGASAQLRPSRRAAEVLPRVDLENQVPKEFSDWKLDKAVIPILPSPDVQEMLDEIYTQLIARTYVRSDGVRIYFTIAYGADQATDATSVHRPEFCYSSQGFTVRSKGDSHLKLDSQLLDVRRLEGRLGSRYEPITYWVTLNDKAVLPGFKRKYQQIKFGLGGLIPDGMLVRVSTINISEEKAFAIQDGFIRDLELAVDPSMRARYFGTI